MTEKETPYMKRRRENLEAAKKEEEEKERFKEEWMKEDEEDKPEPPTEEQREKWLREERKDLILDEIERQLEESGKSDAEFSELRQQLIKQVKLNQNWLAVLENKKWEEILKLYFSIVRGMTNKMCAKTVVTIREKDGIINFTYEFFDEFNAPVITELNDGAKEAMQEDDND